MQTTDINSSEESTNANRRERLAVCEFKKMLGEVEELLKSSGSLAGDDLIHLNKMIMNRIHAAGEFFEDKKKSILYKLHDTSMQTNNYIHERPWPIIGAGVVLGVVCGLLLATKKNSKKI